MEELRLKTPRVALMQVNCENSPYVSYSGNVKNCHMLSGSEHDEDCYYGFWLYDSNDCTDCDYCQKCQLCYECLDCLECYNVSFSQDCVNCTDCEYCFDCTGCKNCFGCSGLRRQQYMIGNQQYSVEEYEKKVEEMKSQFSRDQLIEMLENVKAKAPRLFTHELNNENCSGDYVYNSRDAVECFDVKELEDCLYCNNCVSLKDCVDMSNSYYNSELCYEVMSEMNLYNCNFCITCFDSANLEHCEMVYNSKDCFGCFSLKNAQYCIFNEQFSEKEYETRVAEIRKEMLKTPHASGQGSEYMQFLPSSYPYEDSNAAMHQWGGGPNKSIT